MKLFKLLLAAAVPAAAAALCTVPGTDPRRRALRADFAGRNYAHRGLFTKDQSTPENSLPAFAAAAEAGYGIELDVQFSADRQLLVFHDDTLDRMTGTHGWVRDFAYADIAAMPLLGTAYHAPLFAEVLATVAGRVPLIVEIKSRSAYSDAYLDELCRAVLTALDGYAGPYCIESFDPRVVARIRHLAPGVLRGQLADSYQSHRKEGAGPLHAWVLSHCLGNVFSRPDFIAWGPAPRNWAVRLCAALGAMMVYWTALPEDDQAALQRDNDAVIFQWYTPDTHYKR